MAEEENRIKTGIPGLDLLLYGGIPNADQVVIASSPGCGKTLLCFEILYHNAKAGKKALFITLEESPADIIGDAKSAFPKFNDIDELISKKMLTVMSDDVSVMVDSTSASGMADTFNKLMLTIENYVTQTGAQCVAIDSISILRLFSSTQSALAYRVALLSLVSSLRKLGVTAFLTVELPSRSSDMLRFGPEFFIFDGIVLMYPKPMEDRVGFFLEVIKMRRTRHNLTPTHYSISSEGFKIFAEQQQEVF